MKVIALFVSKRLGLYALGLGLGLVFFAVQLEPVRRAINSKRAAVQVKRENTAEIRCKSRSPRSKVERGRMSGIRSLTRAESGPKGSRTCYSSGRPPRYRNTARGLWRGGLKVRVQVGPLAGPRALQVLREPGNVPELHTASLAL